MACGGQRARAPAARGLARPTGSKCGISIGGSNAVVMKVGGARRAPLGVGARELPLRRRKATRVMAATKEARKVVIPEPSFNVPLGLFGIAGLFALAHAPVLSLPFGVLGAFLTFQATRVKFQFDDEALEVLIGDEKAESDNAFVGGRYPLYSRQPNPLLPSHLPSG